MKQPKLRSMYFLYGVMVVVTTLFCCYLHFFVPYEDQTMEQVELTPLNSGWTYTYGGSSRRVNLPYLSSIPVGDTCAISIVLPKIDDHDTALCLRTVHTYVRAYMDGRLIYSYGYANPDYQISETKGFLYNTIRLPEGASGKTLRIELRSVDARYSGRIETVSLGNYYAIELHMLQRFMPGYIICGIILLFGLVTLIFYFMSSAHYGKKNVSFLYITFFAVQMGIWALGKYHFYQIFLGDPQLAYFIDYYVQYLDMVPFLWYVASQCVTPHRRILYRIAAVQLLFAMGCFLLQTTGTLDLYHTLNAFFTLVFIGFAAIGYVMIQEFREKKNHRLMVVTGYSFFAIGGAVYEILVYYHNPYMEHLFVLPFFVLIFIVFLTVSSASRYFTLLSNQQRSELLLKLADVDMMTGAPNRNAYEKYLQERAAHPEKNTACYVTLFDMNYLKYINDTFGHRAGDAALKKCYQILSDVIGEQGHIFRIGGDEFICISPEPLTSELTEISLLAAAHDAAYPLSIAYGAAHYKPEYSATLAETIRLADGRMYEHKKELKQIDGEVYDLRQAHEGN